MNVLVYWITYVLIFLMVCTGIVLLCRKIFKNRYNEFVQKYKIFGITNIIVKCFLVLYIPVLLFRTVFSIIDIFAYSTGIDQMLSTVVIAIIAIIIEQTIEHTELSKIGVGSPDYGANNTAVFSYIDLYREVEQINLNLINQLSISQTDLLSQSKLTQKETNNILRQINNYVKLQNSECHNLIEKKNDFDNFFDELCTRLDDFCKVFKQYEKKLDNSAKAMTYYDNGQSLTVDISESFQTKYKQSANEFMKRLNDVEQQLRGVVDQYSRFKDYIQPHIENVSVYNAKMDTTLQSLKEEAESKQTILENTSNRIAENVKEMNNNMKETLNNLDQYLNKNSFVLLKILETYKTNILTPRGLKKMLNNWLIVPGRKINT